LPRGQSWGACNASIPCRYKPGRNYLLPRDVVWPLDWKDLSAWIGVFLATTILTPLTGFPLRPFGFDAARTVGVLSLVLLVGAVAAYYGFRLTGAWRCTFVACAVAALYLNVFVLVAQGFLKVPALHELAPTQSEPPFAIVQGIVLVIFIALGIWAAIRFRPDAGGRLARR
jgi:hypothetical protein